MVRTLEKFDYFFLTRSRQKTIGRAATALASGLNGTLEQGGFWRGMPKVLFKKNKVPVVISFFNAGAKVPLLSTRIVLSRVAQDKFHMRIYNATILSRIAKRFGIHGFETGDAGFDKIFRVKCNDKTTAKRFLDPWAIRSLKALCDTPNSTLESDPAIPDSMRERAESEYMDGAMKVIDAIFTPIDRPVFEVYLDKKGLTMEILGLLDTDKALRMLDELFAIYFHWN